MSEPRRDLARTTLGVLFIAGLIFASFWIIRPFLAPLIWATLISPSPIAPRCHGEGQAGS